MKAWYCICKNTYTTKNCKCNKEGRRYYSALPHGIGPLTGQGNSTVDNTNTSRQSSSDSTDYQL
jgi:hypothetical protein